MFDAVSIIGAKRDGRELSGTEIDWIVQAFTQGIVGDEQMSALAMAIYFRGMSRAETGRWTEAMIESGGRMDFSDLPLPTVDKHSTVEWGTRSPFRLHPSSLPVVLQSRSCRAADSATPVELSTSSRPFQVGEPSSRRRRWSTFSRIRKSAR